MDVEFGILGPTGLGSGSGLRDDWGSRQLRAVLATLLVHANRPVSVDTVAEWVWPEERQPRNAAGTLDTYAHRIRTRLRRLGGTARLRGVNGALHLQVRRELIDFHRFRELVSAAREHRRERDLAAAADCMENAFALLRGRPLEDVETPRAQSWRTRFEDEDLLPAHQVLLTTFLELGRYEDTLTRLVEIQPDHTLDLSLAKLRISVLYHLQRDDEAMAYYMAARGMMRDAGLLQAADFLKQHHDSLLPRQVDLPRPVDPVPPPRRPALLPHDIVDFVGRDNLLAELDVATTAPDGGPLRGVVAVDGMAGVGKTALIVHWGHLSRSRFPGGELYANLNGFSAEPRVEHPAVVNDLLVRLGHQPDKTMSPRAREVLLNHLLAENHTLVILDNARDTAHVKDLIPILSDCLVIVTSRRRLTGLCTTTGARRVHVPLLSKAESVGLLTSRVRGRADLGGSDERIAELCGGLPLVLSVVAEHIAGHHDVWSDEHTARLDAAKVLFHLDEEGDGAASPHTVFGWSYDAMPEPERRLFRLLGSHPGQDFGVDLAIACDGRDPERARVALNALAGVQLVERTGEVDRYRFHDLIREFAIHCAKVDESADDRAAAEQRMLAFFLASAVEANRMLYPNHLEAPPMESAPAVPVQVFANERQAKDWLRRERPNLMAAMRLAERQGHHGYAWRLVDATGIFLERHGYHDDCRVARELAVSSARRDGHAEAEASAEVELGQTYMELGRLDDAARCLDVALRYVMENDNDRARITTFHYLGRLATIRGEFHAGIDLFKKCLAIATAVEDNEALCWTHCYMGNALRATGQVNEALMHLHQAHALAALTRDVSGTAKSLAGIGAVYRDLGSYDVAASHCEEALAIVREIPDLPLAIEFATDLAKINMDRGRLELAEDNARQAAELAERTSSIPSQAQALELLGSILSARRAFSEARQAWRSAAALYELLQEPHRAYQTRNKLDILPLDDARDGRPA